jgi:subtilisin family serine protease
MEATRFAWAVVCCLFVVSGCGTESASSSGSVRAAKSRAVTKEKIIVQCAGDCADTAVDVTRLGGRIDTRFRNVAALAATIPSDQVQPLTKLSSVKGLTKDKLLSSPRPIDTRTVAARSNAKTQVLTSAALTDLRSRRPLNFLYNDIMTGAAVLLEQDITGRGVVVAVIDSGTANNADVVASLADTVVGGENFVDLPDEPSATSTLNDPHGTMVGTMIAGHAAIVLPNDDDLVLSLMEHSPDSVIPVSATESAVPLLGSAPEASIYAFKVFPADGGGTAGSVVLAAMDRAITLKRNFLDGMPSDPVSGDGTEDDPFVYDSLNIQVANLSLGGPSLFPGFEVDDLLVLEMLEAGITVTVAVGNEGPAHITGGSPGTSVAALGVGAAYDPVHRRVLADLELGLGQGVLFHPSEDVQMALFSSRGPTADGRRGIDVVANGVANFLQAANGDLGFASGTSFSAPTVAGGAALLQSAFPDATAAQIRNAIIASANPDIIGPVASAFDQGAGFVDFAAAYDLLAAGAAEDTIPELPDFTRPSFVVSNLRAAGLRPVSFDRSRTFTTPVTATPGQPVQFLVPSSILTGNITVALTNVTPELPPEEQNTLLGDTLLLSVYDAPLSFDPIRFEGIVQEDTTLDFPFPQTGLVRVVVSGIPHNVGNVTADLAISYQPRRLGRQAARGRIADEETDIIELEVPPGTAQVNFELVWNMNWSIYPTHDLDLYAMDPEGNIVLDPDFGFPPGATLNSPERTVVADPIPGIWTLFVDGFMLHGFSDSYRVYATNEAGQAIQRVPDDD